MSKSGAGALRHQITLYQPTSGTTPNGAPINNAFEEVTTTRAKVWQQNVSSKEVGDLDQVKGVYRIKLRWRPVFVGWVVQWGEQLLRVEGIDDADDLRQYKYLTLNTENGVLEMQNADSDIVDDLADRLHILVHTAR